MPTPTLQSEQRPGDAIRSAAIDAVSSDSCELPVLPEVSVQLLKLTGDVECDPADIVALFKRDQSLTGHLLKITNSARYGGGQTVTSIQHAVARLGLIQVREIVMLISCQSQVFNVDGFDDDVRNSFELSLATAAFNQEIARVRRLNVEDAFLCGLLHDVGRPVLLQALSDIRSTSEIDCSDEELREAAELNRIPMATRLVMSWELPQRIADTIDYQTNPLEAGDMEVQAAMLSMAIDLAKAALEGSLNADTCSHPLVDVLNLYPEDLTTIAQQAETITNWVKATA